MEVGVMLMKRYSTFSKALGLVPHYQLQYSIISKTFIGGGYTPVSAKLVYCTPLTD